MDLELVETGNGGDLVKNGKGLSVISGLQNMIYLALFGGNVEGTTPKKRLASEQDLSWFGNSLLMPNSPETQFNSLTERKLNEVPLTSAGRIEIERTVKKDLEFMKAFAEVSVAVSIPATDKVNIDVRVKQPGNLQQQTFTFIWDRSKNELQ